MAERGSAAAPAAAKCCENQADIVSERAGEGEEAEELEPKWVRI
jgi:hypothetical protein